MKIKRREFITLLGGAAAAWPMAAEAQQPAMPVIGYLAGSLPGPSAFRVRALLRGLGETGYADGRNMVVEYRWTEGRDERLPELAGDLVLRQVSVIVASGTPATLAAKAATATIPIVFGVGGDPVELGLVASLNRPGGTLTGVTTLNVELGPKRLQLLHEMVPAAKTIAFLINPTVPITENQVNEMQAAARTLGLQLHILNVSNEHEFEASVASLSQLQIGGLVVAVDPFLNDRAERLGALTLRQGIPAIDAYREFAAAGGLMSYAAGVADQYRLIGGYVGRILKGETPADLPVQQATRVELIINMKTARALGLTFPITLLGRADEAIE